jgi:hypothetical protein
LVVRPGEHVERPRHIGKLRAGDGQDGDGSGRHDATPPMAVADASWQDLSKTVNRGQDGDALIF